MAQVKSWMKLQGSMGETTFKKIGKKVFANDKVVISPELMKTHRKYRSLRKNGKQMGNASKSAEAIRGALSSIINYSHDTKMASRFTGEVMKVVRKDDSRGAYSRGMIARAENMSMLLGFTFNAAVPLRTTFNVAYTTEVNRETGVVKINISPFKPAWCIKAPPLATQFKIMAQIAAIDFDMDVEFNKKYESIDMYVSDSIQLNDTPTAPMSITFTIKTGNVNTIFIALGVDFLDFSNPLYATIDTSRRVSSGCIVGVDEGVTVPFTGPVKEEIV